MKLLIFWDIYWKKGRQLMQDFLPNLMTEYSPDFVIANSENITNGRWPNLAHIREMEALWIDILTGWNHSFAKMDEIADYMDSPESIQIRPANFYESKHYKLPGKGYKIIEKNRKRLAVINLISGNFLKDDVYNPFLKIEEILAEISHEKTDGIIVDFHRESTAESYCMAKWLDGKVSLQYGTHTHVQTNDDRILPLWTGAITDIGMTGALDSSIGQSFDGWIPQFVSGTSHFSGSKDTEMGPGVICGLIVEIENWKTVHIDKIRITESI
jgi:2',3'-cyclic-nucleotide 2'-phosphodiesterase